MSLPPLSLSGAIPSLPTLPLQPPPMPLTPGEIIRGVRTLPSLPVIVLELLQSIDVDATSMRGLADRISHDQGLAAASLRLANSAFFGMPTQVNSM